MLDREPHVEGSGALLTVLERKPRMAFVAWHTLSNVYYLVSRARNDAEVRDFLVDLIRFVTVAPSDTDALRYAASLPLKDFEDAMQVAVARGCGAEVIATRNVRDFSRSPTPARTPVELVRELR